MKLMGISKLEISSQTARQGLKGAISALVSELEAGHWQSMSDLAGHYPLASISGLKVSLPLDDDYRVEFLADCEAQMILIEEAGASGARASSKGSNAA